MSYIVSWVTAIIIFLLIATLLDMLLPSSAMHRYVKLALSLMLMVLLLQPLFSLIKADVNELLPIDAHWLEANEDVKADIEAKKMEIQSGQDAYISKQLAVQLQEQAERSVADQFNLQLTSVEVIGDMNRWIESEGEEPIIFQAIVTPIREQVETAVFAGIKEVNISLYSEQRDDDDGGKEDALRTHLASIWNVPTSNVNIQWEGGARE